MTNHPANLILRLFLQIVALVAIGQWGWQLSSGPLRFLYAVGFPLLAAVLWMTFAVPEDRPSGKAPVPVSGRVRLALELGLFLLAVLCMLLTGRLALAIAFVLTLVLHYFWSLDRVRWLLKG